MVLFLKREIHCTGPCAGVHADAQAAANLIDCKKLMTAGAVHGLKLRRMHQGAQGLVRE
jgi:hypothetical protein